MHACSFDRAAHNAVLHNLSVELPCYASHSIIGPYGNVLHGNPPDLTVGYRSCKSACLIRIIVNGQIFHTDIRYHRMSDIIGKSSFLGILRKSRPFDRQIRDRRPVCFLKEYRIQPGYGMAVSVQLAGESTLHCEIYT